MAEFTVVAHRELIEEWDTYRKIADFTDGSKERVLKYLVPHRSETDGTAEGEAALADDSGASIT